MRRLVLETAEKIDTVQQIEETLKRNEPSYLTKHGSTLRMDWKVKKPEQYALYFKCTSKLVETFRAVFGDLFRCESNRAILFNLDEKVPEEETKKCIKMTLQYHKLKDNLLSGETQIG